jgi:hypothetical protein
MQVAQALYINSPSLALPLRIELVYRQGLNIMYIPNVCLQCVHFRFVNDAIAKLSDQVIA